MLAGSVHIAICGPLARLTVSDVCLRSRVFAHKLLDNKWSEASLLITEINMGTWAQCSVRWARISRYLLLHTWHIMTLMRFPDGQHGPYIKWINR